MIDVQQSLGAWIQQVQGKYVDMDGAYGAQCWDLAAHWSTFLGLPVINTGGKGRWPGWAGNMVDAFPQSSAIAAAYSLHAPHETGHPGDIVVWDDSYWYYPATHVAVLYADKDNQLVCMSQNSTPSRPDNPYPGASSGPTTIQSLPRQGLLGFIRPRTGISAQGEIVTPVQEDDIMTATQEQQDAFIQRLMDYQINQAGGGKVTLGEHIAEARGHTMDTIRVIEGLADEVLDTVVEGVAGDRITLRQLLAEYRAHIIQDQAASAAIIAAKAAAGGASVEEIQKAVHDALASGIRIDATVRVAE